MALWTRPGTADQSERMRIAWEMRQRNPPATFSEIAAAFGLKYPAAAREAYARAEHAVRKGEATWLSRTHEVRVLCNCDDEPCKMELYVSDVRILREGVEERLHALETATAVLRDYVKA